MASVDVVEKKVENQVHFWSLLGPFLVLLSIAVLLFKVSSHWYFPISALIGIPLCVKWKINGMVAALGCLFLLAGFNYQNLDLDDRYWHVGLSLAMAFSFIVLTLSLEEVQGLVSKLQLESQSRLDNFLLLDDKWKTAEQDWDVEKEKVHQEVTALKIELSTVLEDKQTFYKLAQLSKDELVQVKGQHELLLQDLFYKKEQISQLYERLDETEMTIQGFVNSDSEKQIQNLNECIAKLERENDLTIAKIVIALEERTEACAESEKLRQELKACEIREKACLADQHVLSQSQQEYEENLQALNTQFANIQKELDFAKEALTQSQLQENTQRLNLDQLKLELAAHQNRETNLLQQNQQYLQQSQQEKLKYEKDLQNLTTQWESVKKELTSVKESLSQSQRKEEGHKQTLDQLKLDLNSSQAREANLHQQNQQILQHSQQEKSRYEKDLHNLTNECMRSLNELGLARENLEQLQLKEEEYKKQICQFTLDLETHQSHQESFEERQQQILQHSQQEKQELQKELRALKNQIACTEEELILTKEELVQTHAQEEKYQEHIRQMSSDLETHQTREMSLQERLQQILQNSQEEKQALKQEMSALQVQCDDLQDKLQSTSQGLHERNENLLEMRTKVAVLNHQLREQQSLLAQSMNACQELERLKRQLEEGLKQSQTDLQQVRGALETQQGKNAPAPVNVTSPAHRGFESMYLQLKDQFKEKCGVLDATRRELFLANEELLKFRKDYEEEHVFGQSLNEKHLQRHVIKLSKQFEKMSQFYQQEIDELNQLIGHLLKK